MEFTEKLLLKHKKYLELLSLSYPTIQSACTEIINLQAILNLPKGTEHFISDIHGEYEAYTHILRNASGSLRRKIDEALGNTLTEEEKNALATLFYYPKLKLHEINRSGLNTREWYQHTLKQMVAVCRRTTQKYTRSKVRKALPPDFEYIISELINAEDNNYNKEEYFQQILDAIIDIDRADEFIIAIAELAQRMVIDKLHILGDIYDRGSFAHLVMDDLCSRNNVDIQWGNHDILWMGAAAGQLSCIANVIRNSFRYNNFDVLEEGYGINIRPLSVFAMERYAYDPCSLFMPKKLGPNAKKVTHDDLIAARLHKAIAVIQFKLESQVILSHPEYEMDHRLLLDKVNFESGTVTIDGVEHALLDTYFPTINPEDPFTLSPEEESVMMGLQTSFLHSEKLQKHCRFLLEKGSMYKVCNGNLLFHGCIPIDKDGNFTSLTIHGETYSGKKLMDFCDRMARQGILAADNSEEKKAGMDFLWFMWCGPKSPLNGKDKMATFERYFVADETTWKERKDPYYTMLDKKEVADAIFQEFGITDPLAKIINGHIPVKIKKGESPLRANGKLIIIDGGISRAYQPVTGIAGYTLVSNSCELYLSEHHPFPGIQEAIDSDCDMHSNIIPVLTYPKRIKIRDTDDGKIIAGKIEDLQMLLAAYRMGILKAQ